MRYTLVILFLLLLNPLLKGQLQPLVDLYEMDGLAVNPAYAGSQEALSITTSSRIQWIGFEGAPRTISLAAHTPMRNKKTNLGLLLLNDQLGSKNETGAMLNYAYRMKLKNGKLSLGMAAGLSNLNTDLAKVRFTDTGDDLIQVSARRATLPEFSLGAYYYSKRFYLGVSMPLFLTQFNTSGSGNYRPVFNLATSNYMASAGYVWRISENLDILPSVMLRSNPVNSTQLDIHCKFIIKQRFWIGSSIRTNGNLSALIQFQANPQFRIGYAYSYELSPLSSYQQGTHEIILRYSFRYLIDVMSPRYF